MRGIRLSVVLPGQWPGRTDVGRKSGFKNETLSVNESDDECALRSTHTSVLKHAELSV